MLMERFRNPHLEIKVLNNTREKLSGSLCGLDVKVGVNVFKNFVLTCSFEIINHLKLKVDCYDKSCKSTSIQLRNGNKSTSRIQYQKYE